MQNPLIIIIFISVAFGCKEQNPRPNDDNSRIENEEVTNKMGNSIDSETDFINAENFKFSKLDEYDLRNWDFSKMTEELKQLSQDEILRYFQFDENKEGEFTSYNYRYFSIQKNTKNEKIITLIKFEDGCCSNLHLLIYDEYEKLISDNIIAGTGGDGIWYYDAYGKFLDDSTYQLIRVDFEEVELENDEYAQKIDSSVTRYRFYKERNLEIMDVEKFENLK